MSARAGSTKKDHLEMSLTVIPSLDELVRDPGRVQDLSSLIAASILTQVASLQTLLLGRLLTSGSTPDTAHEDRLLTVGETAVKLGTTADWLYRQAPTLPFTVRMGRQLRFSERGVERWIKTRQGR